MKNYTITVNGNVYDVTVEEGASSGVAPVAAPVVKAPAAPVKKSGGFEGAIKVEAGAAGKVLKINASVGQAVKKGDTVVTIESMKMEIPMVAPSDGTVASIEVAAGDAVEAGTCLATLN